MSDPSKYRKRSRKWWDAVRDLYTSGDIASLREISKRFGVPYGTVAGKSSSEKWGDRKRERAALTESARKGAVHQALELSKRTQAETRVNYAEKARELANAILDYAKRMVDANRATPADLQKLSAALQNCKNVEFAALGIASEVLTFTDDEADGGAATWEEMMRRERESAGLAEFNFSREEQKS